jgi:hypothetical protein
MVQLQRIEPRQEIGVTFPPRRFAASQGWIDLLQRLSLRFQVGLRIVVGRIEARVTQPASNHRNVNARRHQMDASWTLTISIGCRTVLPFPPQENSAFFSSAPSFVVVN